MLGVLIIILVYIVMAAQFESLTYPGIIMTSLLFAFSGVFLILWMTGHTLNVMSMIGAIMLIGIVVKNGIVLIDYITLNRERGRWRTLTSPSGCDDHPHHNPRYGADGCRLRTRCGDVAPDGYSRHRRSDLLDSAYVALRASALLRIRRERSEENSSQTPRTTHQIESTSLSSLSPLPSLPISPHPHKSPSIPIPPHVPIGRP